MEEDRLTYILDNNKYWTEQEINLELDTLELFELEELFNRALNYED